MSTTRCPMCGRPNPPDLEHCQYCDARLKVIKRRDDLDALESREFDPSGIAAESQPSGSVLPDWLESLRETNLEPVQLESSTDGGTQDTSDWILEQDLFDRQNNLISDDQLNAQPEFPPETAKEERNTSKEPTWSEEELPDWLMSLRSGESKPELVPLDTAKEEVERQAESDQHPEILIPSSLHVPGESEVTKDDSPLEDPLTAWESEEENFPSREEKQSASQSEWQSKDTFEEDEYPKWLDSLQGQALDSDEGGSEPSESEYLQNGIPPFTNLQDVEPFDINADWLERISHQIEDQDVGEGIEQDNTNSTSESDEQTELPSWLEAMRPERKSVIKLIPSDAKIEHAGPLVGLRGALEAEPDVARQKPVEQALVKLQITDKQQAQAEIFAKQIENEGQPKSVTEARPFITHRILRILVLIVLLSVAVYSLLTGGNTAPQSGYTAETFDVFQIIGNITPNQPVLVIVDYEPGYSGELNAVAGSLIDHLMIKGEYLVMVSTTPMGPLQAERLVHLVNKTSRHQYQSGANYINLGFISGDAPGMRSFADAPRSILPFDINTEPGWFAPALANVTNLADFELVLILTESVERSRNWLEQLSPYSASVPIIIGGSAQVEPVIRPYYEAKNSQLRGFIPGLPGGVAYEQLIARTGLAFGFWNAYLQLVPTAAGMILLGIALNLILNTLTKSKKMGKEARR